MAKIHPNYIKASNLIFGSAVLSLISEFILSSLSYMSIVTTLLIVGLGFVVRQGKSWVKYLLLVMTMLGLAATVIMFNLLIQNLLLASFYFAQTIMQIWILVLLFKVPVIKEHDSLDSFLIDENN